MLRRAAPDGRPIEYRRLGLRDFDVPAPEQMAEILATLGAALDAGHTVSVHCWGGVGRTGTVTGCYLVERGLDGEEALANTATTVTFIAARIRRLGTVRCLPPEHE